jgi:diacylglycerol kinase family enzyme
MDQDSPSKKHLFIINPRSFLNFREINRVIAEITRCFERSQGASRAPVANVAPDLPSFYSPESPYAIHISRFPRDAIIIIRKYMALAREEATVRVYAVGGDGVVFDCLNGIAGLPNAELAIVPYGTGSDFLQAFGGKELVPVMWNIAEQIKAPAIPADIIDCGDIYALNSCAVGIEAKIVIRSYPMLRSLWKLRRRSGMLTEAILLISSLMELFDTDSMEQRYRLRIDDEELEGVMPLIHIANSPGYPVHKSVVPEAVPDDGLLDIVAGRKTSLATRLRFVPRYLKGQHGKFSQYGIYRQARSISVSSDQPLCIILDGDVFFDTSFTARVLPQAVRIASPGGRPFKNRTPDHAKQ